MSKEIKEALLILKANVQSPTGEVVRTKSGQILLPMMSWGSRPSKVGT